MLTQSALDAYHQTYLIDTPGIDRQPEPIDQFNVHAFNQVSVQPMPYIRWDFYKISLYTSGSTELQYAGQDFLINRPTLALYNPRLPYACHIQTPLSGFSCSFTNAFLAGSERTASLQESPLFRIGSHPLVELTDEQTASIRSIFGQMVDEYQSSYRHKYELLRTYVQQLVHEALRLHADRPLQYSSATSRLLTQFIALLEAQFPISSPAQPVRMKTAQDFAGPLRVHVNYLNRVVQQLTGRTTRTFLAQRIGQEAKALLLHTEWSVAQIGACLGFGDATNFSHFFRQQTGVSPRAFRQQAVNREKNG